MSCITETLFRKILDNFYSLATCKYDTVKCYRLFYKCVYNNTI